MIPNRLRELGVAILYVCVAGAVFSVIESTGWFDADSVRLPTPIEFIYGLNLHFLFGLAIAIVLRLIFWRTGRVSFSTVVLVGFLAAELGVVAAYWLAKAPFAPPTWLLKGKLFALGSVGGGILIAIGLGIPVAKRLRGRWDRDSQGRVATIGLLVGLLLVICNGVTSWKLRPEVRKVTLKTDASSVERQDLIVILVDTLRKDHLSFFGYDRPTSPNIDVLLSESYVFAAGYTPSNWTIPSVASLFTGLYPSAHRISSGFEQLPDQGSILSTHLRSYGYRTGAFIANHILTGGTGYENGFETFFPQPAPWWVRTQRTAFERIAIRIGTSGDAARGWKINEEAVAFFERNIDEPRFAYIHYIGPHSPYTPEESDLRAVAPNSPDGPDMPPLIQDYEDRLPDVEVRQWQMMESPPTIPEPDLTGMIARYDGEIRLTDRRFEQLRTSLEELDIFDKAHILFITDHGEEFGDHQGWYHGLSVYDEMVSSPMAYRPPGGVPGGRIIETPTQMLDLFYTVLVAMGVTPPESYQGKLLPDIQGGTPEARFAFSERPPHLYCVREGKWKLVQRGDRARPEWLLFDMETDPKETQNLAPIETDTLARLQSLLTRQVARIKQQGLEVTTKDDPQFRERLRSLGYIK